MFCSACETNGKKAEATVKVFSPLWKCWEEGPIIVCEKCARKISRHMPNTTFGEDAEKYYQFIKSYEGAEYAVSVVEIFSFWNEFLAEHRSKGVENLIESLREVFEKSVIEKDKNSKQNDPYYKRVLEEFYNVNFTKYIIDRIRKTKTLR